MKRRRRSPKAAKRVRTENHASSIKERLRPPMSKSVLTDKLQKMYKRFAVDSPQRHWRLAGWFVAFVQSQDLHVFKEEAEYLASTKGRGAFREENIDEALRRVQGDAKTVIEWYLDKATRGTTVSHAPPLDYPVNVELIPCRVGDRFETSMIGQDFSGRLLLKLFDLLSTEKRVFARCAYAICRKIFAPRGRQLYCSTGCADRSRPVEKRRKWMRDYMRERRATLNRLCLHISNL